MNVTKKSKRCSEAIAMLEEMLHLTDVKSGVNSLQDTTSRARMAKISLSWSKRFTRKGAMRPINKTDNRL